jgi:hypothetical protein
MKVLTIVGNVGELGRSQVVLSNLLRLFPLTRVEGMLKDPKEILSMVKKNNLFTGARNLMLI